MTLAEAVISGVVQGLTEFLPVSSSGHLALLQGFFGAEEPAVFFDICLHAATLAAVVCFFRREIFAGIKGRDLRMAGCIAVATVPAVAAGLLFEDRIEAIFSSPRVVSSMFFVTALALFAGQWALGARTARAEKISYGRSFFVGIAQAVALLPGVSRSGLTVSAGLLSGLAAGTAFMFSFLMSIPVILAALVYKAVKTDLAAELGSGGLDYAAGMVAAFVVGMLGLMLLRGVIRAKKIYIFGIYCLLLGIVGILYL